ncbi:hypothetical protein SAMN05428984_1776 [Sphingomonas sp. OK281]|nr:hypothetical protein SAMN05428984_1776 [Sphingomonas sp. OK281]
MHMVGTPGPSSAAANSGCTVKHSHGDAVLHVRLGSVAGASITNDMVPLASVEWLLPRSFPVR